MVIVVLYYCERILQEQWLVTLASTLPLVFPDYSSGNAA